MITWVFYFGCKIWWHVHVYMVYLKSAKLLYNLHTWFHYSEIHLARNKALSFNSILIYQPWMRWVKSANVFITRRHISLFQIVFTILVSLVPWHFYWWLESVRVKCELSMNTPELILCRGPSVTHVIMKFSLNHVLYFSFTIHFLRVGGQLLNKNWCFKVFVLQFNWEKEFQY